MSEDQLCVQCFTWAWNERPHTRGFILHIPNGGYRNKIEAAKLKQMGVLPGFPDYQLILPGGRIVLLEAKTKTGSLSKAQKELHDLYSHNYIPVNIFRSLEEWQSLIDFYFPQSKNNNHES